MLRRFLKARKNIPARKPIIGARVYIRPPLRRDAAAWVALRLRNQGFFRPWSPLAALRGITRAGYLSRLSFFRADWEDDRAYVFLVFLKGDDRMIGGITINNVVRGAGQMATLGYWMDEQETQKGYMTEAVRLACGFGFQTLGLNRLQAGTLPENAPSRKVLEKCGFLEEGIARRYICINGEWRDHLIFALTQGDGADQA